MAVLMIMLKSDKLYLAEGVSERVLAVAGFWRSICSLVRVGGSVTQGRDSKFDRETPVISRKLPKYIRQLSTIQAK
jgi:hypothetical protein